MPCVAGCALGSIGMGWQAGPRRKGLAACVAPASTPAPQPKIPSVPCLGPRPAQAPTGSRPRRRWTRSWGARARCCSTAASSGTTARSCQVRREQGRVQGFVQGRVHPSETLVATIALRSFMPLALAPNPAPRHSRHLALPATPRNHPATSRTPPPPPAAAHLDDYLQRPGGAPPSVGRIEEKDMADVARFLNRYVGPINKTIGCPPLGPRCALRLGAAAGAALQRALLAHPRSPLRPRDRTQAAGPGARGAAGAV